MFASSKPGSRARNGRRNIRRKAPTSVGLSLRGARAPNVRRSTACAIPWAQSLRSFFLESLPFGDKTTGASLDFRCIKMWDAAELTFWAATYSKKKAMRAGQVALLSC